MNGIFFFKKVSGNYLTASRTSLALLTSGTSEDLKVDPLGSSLVSLLSMRKSLFNGFEEEIGSDTDLEGSNDRVR